MNTKCVAVCLALSAWGPALLAQQGAAPPPGQGGALTLEAAIDEAVSSNLQLAAEKRNIAVAQTQEITARLRPNPVLTVSGQTLNLLGAQFNPNTPLGPNQANVHTDLPIERGGKRQSRMAYAAAELEAAGLGVRELTRRVVFAVESAYVDVQLAKADLALAQQNLAYLQNVVEVNQARLRSGDLAQVELERSQIAALQYATAVDEARLQLEQSKTQLRLLLGRPPGAPIDVDDRFRSDPLSVSEPEVARLAFDRRPDLLLDQQAKVRSQADLRLQLANGKVDYSIGAEYTHQRAWGIGGSSVGLYFSMPLPLFNRNQGEIARAEQEIALAGARVTAANAEVAAEVEKAYREYEVSRALLANVENNMLAKARAVRETTEYSYRRGEATLVEFLDAQRAFNDTMQAYNAARAGYARSLYQIDSVSGATPGSH
ncbi:MAG: TolC family protein [Acidobacteria bacterium]|nr:TolC family protein [Acidobacteriota bacterium]